MAYVGQLFPPATPPEIGQTTILEVVTNSILPGETLELEFSTPSSYQINSVVTSCPCWLRVYGTSYGRSTDSRIEPGPPFPEPGSGFCAEAQLVSNNLTTSFSPPADVQVENTSTLLKIRNDSGIAQGITITFEVIVQVYGVIPSSPPYNCSTAVDTRGQQDLSNAWFGCSLITQLPLFDLSSATNLESAWENCTLLKFVPPKLFDNCPATNLINAFTNCSLSAGSVDNILVSLDEAGYENGTVDLSGGNNQPPSVVGLSAKTNLEAKGWTVNTVSGGSVSYVDIGEEVYSLTSFGDGRVFAGSTSGSIYKSLNYGGTFDAGTLVGAGRIYSIAACQGNTVIAGTWADSFPWVSTDNGDTWGAGTDFNQSEVDSVAYAGGGVIYIGTYGYIHKSEDNGLTWSQSEPVPTGDYYISIAFPGTGKVVVGTYEEGYLVRTSDGGSTWATTGPGVLDGLLSSMFGLASDGLGVVIASTDGDGRVFRSDDSGETWDSGTQLGLATEVRCLTCSPTGVFYAGTNDAGKIYRSSDGGVTWEEFYDPGIPTGYVYSLTNGGEENLLAGIDTFVYSIPYTYVPPSEIVPTTQIYPVFSSIPSNLVKSDTAGITGASQVTNIVSISQLDYDNLLIKDPTTLYVIVN